VTGVIPDSLITRRKQGFGVPGEWYEHFNRVARFEVDRFCSETDLLERDVALSYLNGGYVRSWALLNLALWHREFF
jgi:hypothetical protein